MKRTEDMTLHEQLLFWHERGWWPLPCVVYVSTDKDGRIKREKCPLVEWKKYQTRAPTKDEIDVWGKNKKWSGYAGVLLIMGNGVVGVDFDQQDGKPNIEPWADCLLASPTMHTVTASGGFHYFFKTDAPLQNKTNIFYANKTKGETTVDIRAEGGIIVVGETPLWDKNPQNGKNDARIIGRYKTDNVISPHELPPIPSVFADRAKEMSARWKEAMAETVVPIGSRHDVAKSIIAKLIYHVKTPEDIPAMKQAFYDIMHKRFESSLSNSEVERMFDWTVEQERKKRGGGWYLFNSVVMDAVKKTKQEREYDEDMKEWDVKIDKIERNDDIITFHIAGGESCMMETSDLFSQVKFRAAYVRGTNVVLPPIRKDSYLRFIQSVPIFETKELGSSLDDAIMECALGREGRTAPSESKDEAMENAIRHGWGKFGGIIYFKLPTFIMELKHTHPTIRRSILTNTMRANTRFSFFRLNNYRLWSFMYDDGHEDNTGEIHAD